MKNIYIVIIIVVMTFTIFQTAGSMDKKMKTNNSEKLQKTQTAVFAGGCFWCTEADFEKVDGVVEAISGYTGGHVANPQYDQVSKGVTGHIEAVKIIYDPSRISYEGLLEVFWKHIDPTDPGGQFVDRGSQYRSAIFYANDREKLAAENSMKKLAESGRFRKPLVTDILPLGPFYPAEDYHQDYYKNNPLRYRWYRSGSGRDQFLEKAWAGMTPETHTEDTGGMKSDIPGERKKKEIMPSASKYKMNGAATPGMKTGRLQNNTDSLYIIPGDIELRRQLSAMQYKVTRQNGTEPPYNNEYWDNHDAGIYVDIVSGEPLFSSLDKYDSGTGWPSFTRPLEPDNIVEHKDRSFFMVRTEVKSRHADSHLGHVFEDGPKPTGLRYCINSAALRFIAKANLEKEGYGKYLKLFD